MKFFLLIGFLVFNTQIVHAEIQCLFNGSGYLYISNEIQDYSSGTVEFYFHKKRYSDLNATVEYSDSFPISRSYRLTGQLGGLIVIKIDQLGPEEVANAFISPSGEKLTGKCFIHN